MPRTTTSISIGLGLDVLEWVDAQAAKEERSRSNVVNRCLRRYIASQGRPPLSDRQIDQAEAGHRSDITTQSA